MVINKEAWAAAIKWAIDNEGIETFEIDEQGKTLYKNRNKIKCLNKHDQLVYRFKHQDFFPSDKYRLFILTRRRNSGKEIKSYVFDLKGKKTFKNSLLRTETVNLYDALINASRYDREYEDA